MQTNTISICYIVIQDKERYLLVEKKHLGGGAPLWNFPKNDIHLGESVFDAAARIIKEDIDLEVHLTGLVKVLHHSSLSKYSDKPGTIHLAFSFYATLREIPSKFSLGSNVISTKWITKEELALQKFGGPQGAYIARCVIRDEKYPLSLLGPEKTP